MANLALDKNDLKTIQTALENRQFDVVGQTLWNAGITSPEQAKQLTAYFSQLPSVKLALSKWGGVEAAIDKSVTDYEAKVKAQYKKDHPERFQEKAPVQQTSTSKVAPRATPAATPADPINDQFGNDMAWLDPLFKEKPELLGTSARSQVFAEPELVAKQNQALDSLFGIAKDGGASAQERARRAAARRDSENWLRGQREADMSNLAERGMSGSGAEILALGNDRQAAAQRNSAADLETDAWLEQRALDAMMRGGELAGRMRDTGFKEASDRANATDEFDVLNKQALNNAESAYKDFQRKAWEEMIARRNEFDVTKLKLGLDTAGGLLDSDIDENETGYDYTKDVVKTDKGAINTAAGAVNNTLMTGNPQAGAASLASDEALGGVAGGTVQFGGDLVKTAASAGSGGGAMGAAGGFMGKKDED